MILLDQYTSRLSTSSLVLLLLFAIAYSVASFKVASIRGSRNHYHRHRRDYNGILPSATLSVSSLSGDKYNNNINNRKKSTKLLDSKILAPDEVEEGNEDDENINSNNDYIFIWEDSGFEYNDEYNFNDGDFDGNDGEDVIVKWRHFLHSNMDHNNNIDNEDNIIDPNVVNVITRKTMNWCNEFVMKLDLCPFAKASLQTKGAMRFFLVPPIPMVVQPPTTSSVVSTTQIQLEEEYRNRRIVDDVAKRFQTEILNNNNNGNDREDNSNPAAADMFERAAIYFVIFLSNENNDNGNGNGNGNENENEDNTAITTTTSRTSSFIDFLDWFNDLEDNWSEECDDVIIAPFHPDWQFEFDTRDEYALNYEKRSPYPLISIVSTNVVEKAGEAVTELIGENNREILLSIEKEETEIEGNSDSGGPVAKLWQSAIDS
jgi:hypothetical protein